MTPDERFWAKVDKGDGSGCWIWTAAKDQHGYGKVGRAGVVKRAHQVSWELEHGPQARGTDLCHICDNPSCIRPDHLFLGTRKDNMADAARKGRTARGEGHGRHRLTTEQVVEIRLARSNGERLASLAERFGVSLAAISMIARGLQWVDAPGPRAAIDPRWSQ